MIQRFHIQIQGTVQGVYYRKSTKEKAREMGITGYVQNEPDGSVTCEAEGDSELLQRFIAWCHQGPPMAKVERVLSSEKSPQGDRDFEIIR